MAARTTSRNDFTLGFQIKYCLVICACLTASNLYLYNQYLRHGLGHSYFEALVTLSQLEKSLATVLLLTFIVQSLLILLCSLAVILFFTRKISGLVYRFERLLRGISSGDLQHVVRNRDHDQIKSLFSALNSLLTSLRIVYTSVQGVEHNLQQIIRQQENGENPDRQSLRQQIAQTRILLGSSNVTKCEDNRALSE
jgi:methyl-accepting chemotaxis protein